MGATERPLTSRPIGVLLGQVGTPDAPTPAAVRRYLGQFLSDRRVVDYPAWLWQPFLRLVILPTRSRRSARLYQRIWTKDGSPLLVESERQKEKLQQRLGAGYRVVLGMAYAGPSFDRAFDDLIAAGSDRVIVVPMFPQYSSATTASVYDAVGAASTGVARARVFVPAVSYVAPFYDHPDYIGALADRIRAAVDAHRPDHVVLSFHGLPQRYVGSGDPYVQHCRRTVELLSGTMRWTEGFYTVSYQSRFGPERWIEPSTAEVLKALPGRGVRRPLVVAPGFTTDCLETLDELGNEGKAEFASAGGDPAAYAICPCLNADDRLIELLARLVTQLADKTMTIG